jgi:hypothetical protein
MIAVDTSVLVDFIGEGPAAAAAEEALRAALAAGPVVACEVVVSEVVAGLGHSNVVMETLEEVGVGFLPLEMRSALRAGEMQRRYRERLLKGGGAQAVRRSVPDFLIGAHALLQCQGLITRDAGFFRDYFKGLKVIVPKA